MNENLCFLVGVHFPTGSQYLLLGFPSALHVGNGICRLVYILFQTCNTDTREDVGTYMTGFCASPSVCFAFEGMQE